jgi:hypothetical protein
MGRRNYNAFLKRQKAEKKRKAKQEKKQKKEARKNQPSSGHLDNMMAYIDKDGNIISVEPDDENSENEEQPNQN